MGSLWPTRKRATRRAADDLFKKLIEDDKDTKITELAMTARREIAMEALKSKGLRVDAVMYCLGALEQLSSKGEMRFSLSCPK